MSNKIHGRVDRILYPENMDIELKRKIFQRIGAYNTVVEWQTVVCIYKMDDVIGMIDDHEVGLFEDFLDIDFIWLPLSHVI